MITICSTGATCGNRGQRPCGAGRRRETRAQRRRRRLATPGRPHDRISPLRLVSYSMTTSSGNAVARELFAPLGPTYDRYARLLSSARIRAGAASLSRECRSAPTDTSSTWRREPPRWRSSSPAATAAASSGSTRAPRCSPWAEQRVGARASHERVRLVHGQRGAAALRGRELRRADVHVPASLRRRPRRDDARARPRDAPRRAIASLDFVVPPRRLAHALGALRPTRPARPPAALVSPGWHDVGRFLGPSIRGFWRAIQSEQLVGSGAMPASTASRAAPEPRRRARACGERVA